MWVRFVRTNHDKVEKTTAENSNVISLSDDIFRIDD